MFVVLGVIIQTLEPGMVKTKLLEHNHKSYKSSGGLMFRLGSCLTTVSVESFVASAISTIGWSSHCNGNFYHWILEWIAYLSPTCVSDAAQLDVCVH